MTLTNTLNHTGTFKPQNNVASEKNTLTRYQTDFALVKPFTLVMFLETPSSFLVQAILQAMLKDDSTCINYLVNDGKGNTYLENRD